MNIDILSKAKEHPFVAAGIAGLAVLTLSASSCDERGLGDAPVEQVDENERRVWVNGDTFPNISAFCIGNTGVYSTTREAAPAVIADDTNCLPGGVLFDE